MHLGCTFIFLDRFGVKLDQTPSFICFLPSRLSLWTLVFFYSVWPAQGIEAHLRCLLSMIKTSYIYFNPVTFNHAHFFFLFFIFFLSTFITSH